MIDGESKRPNSFQAFQNDPDEWKEEKEFDSPSAMDEIDKENNHSAREREIHNNN